MFSLNQQGKTIYDIGSYVDVTTMFFSRSVGNTGKVIAFEPNPENFVSLQENVALNRLNNVEIQECGLGNKRETRILVVRSCEPARGSMEIHGVDVKSKIENVQKVVEFFDLHGYSIHHVESEREISTTTAQIAKEGHLYCT